MPGSRDVEWVTMLPCRTLPDGSRYLGKLREFWRDESAATAIEYAILAAGIGGTVAAAVYTLGGIVYEDYYLKVLEAVQSAKPPANP
jgi:Flp pilus assembly pilin Flp